MNAENCYPANILKIYIIFCAHVVVRKIIYIYWHHCLQPGDQCWCGSALRSVLAWNILEHLKRHLQNVCTHSTIPPWGFSRKSTDRICSSKQLGCYSQGLCCKRTWSILYHFVDLGADKHCIGKCGSDSSGGGACRDPGSFDAPEARNLPLTQTLHSGMI